MKSVETTASRWPELPLREVADVVMGQSPPGSTYNSAGNGMPFFQGKADFGDDYPIVHKWCTAPTRIAEPGDVLMSVRAPVGPTNIANQRCAIGRGLAAIRSRDSIPPAWIRYALELQESEIASWGTGSTFTAISKKHFEQIRVPIPPRDAIPGLLEVLDGSIKLRRSARAHLDAARKYLVQIRQSVLAAACSGRLTEEWRRNRGVQDSADRPGGWIGSPVSALAASVPRAIQSGPFGSNLLHSEFRTQGRLVIGIDNVLDGEFSMGREHRVSEAKFKELIKYQARPHDVLITVMGTIGRVCVVPPDIEPAIITKHVYRITCDAVRIDPHFLMHSLRGNRAVLAQIESQERGQTRPGLNGKIVKALVVDVPPIEEQREIVRRISDLLPLADDADRRIFSAATAVDASSRSMLMQAFNNV